MRQGRQQDMSGQDAAEDGCMRFCGWVMAYLLPETTKRRGTLAFGSRRKVALQITAAGLSEAPHIDLRAKPATTLPIKLQKEITLDCKLV